MDRKDFIKTCNYACLGASSLVVLLQSCVAFRSVSASLAGDDLILPRSQLFKKGEHLKYVIVRNDDLQFPIYLFHSSEGKYTALHLECTHMGYELNAFGDKLVCSAHGSEFNNKGEVTNGPAMEPLKTFPVHIDGQNILISLKKA